MEWISSSVKSLINFCAVIRSEEIHKRLVNTLDVLFSLCDRFLFLFVLIHIRVRSRENRA